MNECFNGERPVSARARRIGIGIVAFGAMLALSCFAEALRFISGIL